MYNGCFLTLVRGDESSAMIVSIKMSHIPLINLSNLFVPVKLEMLQSVSIFSHIDLMFIFSKDVRPYLRFL